MDSTLEIPVNIIPSSSEKSKSKIKAGGALTVGNSQLLPSSTPSASNNRYATNSTLPTDDGGGSRNFSRSRAKLSKSRSRITFGTPEIDLTNPTFFSNEVRRPFTDFHHNHGLIPRYPLFPDLPPLPVPTFSEDGLENDEPKDEAEQISTLYQVVQRNAAFPPLMASGQVWTSGRAFKDIFCTNGPSWAIGNSYSEESDYRFKNATTISTQISTDNKRGRRRGQKPALINDLFSLSKPPRLRAKACQQADTCDRRYIPPNAPRRDPHNRDITTIEDEEEAQRLKEREEVRQEQRFHIYATVGMRDIRNFPMPHQTFQNICNHLFASFAGGGRHQHMMRYRTASLLLNSNGARTAHSALSTKSMTDASGAAYYRITTLTRSMREEVAQLYDQSVRIATVDYILASPYEQSRMALLPLARFPDHSLQFLSPEMHQNSFSEARKQMCQILFAAHPLLITLHRNWNQRTADLNNPAQKAAKQQPQYFAILDFDLIKPDSSQPIEPEEFQQKVLEACSRFRQRITTEWLNFVCDLYKTNRHTWAGLIKPTPASKSHRIEAFFNATGMLMAQQLLVLVQQANQQLIETFRAYANGNADTNTYTPIMFGQYPFFRLTVETTTKTVSHTSGGGGTQSPNSSAADELILTLVPSEQRLDDLFTTCFHALLDCVRNVPRVENLIFSQMKRIIPRFLDIESLFQAELGRTVQEAKQILHKNLIGPPVYLQKTYFEKFSNFLTNREDERIRTFLAGDGGGSSDRYIELALIEAEVAKLDNTIDVLRQLPTCANLNLFLLDCTQLNLRLVSRCEALRAKLLDYVLKMDRAVIKQVATQFEEMCAKVNEMPEAVRELVALDAFIKNCQVQILPQLYGLIQFVSDNLVFLYSTTQLSIDDVASHTHLFLWPQNIQNAFQVAEQRIMHRRMQAEEAIRRRVQSLSETLEMIRAEAIAFDKRDFSSGANEDINLNVMQLDDITSRIKNVEDETRTINDEEKLLNFEPTAFPAIHEIRVIKQPYDLLWRNALEFQEKYDYWMSRPFVALSPADIEGTSVRIGDIMYDLVKSFGPDVPAARRAADTFKKRIEQFRQYIPFVTAISNPALKPRHWKDAQILLGRELPLKPESTLHEAITEWNLYTDYDKIAPVLNKVWEELAAERKLKEEQEAKLLTEGRNLEEVSVTEKPPDDAVESSATSDGI